MMVSQLLSQSYSKSKEKNFFSFYFWIRNIKIISLHRKSKVKMYEWIVKWYQELFARVSGNREFLFTPSKAQQKQIENFILFLDDRIGLESLDELFVFQFLCFQFDRRKDQKTRFGKGVVMLNHAIGKKAYEVWERKGDNWGFYLNLFIKQFNIPRPIQVKVEKDCLKISEGEEKLKELSKGQENLLESCVNMTSLFHPKSSICTDCGQKLECQEIQSEIYPTIHQLRKTN